MNYAGGKWFFGDAAPVATFGANGDVDSHAGFDGYLVDN